MALGPVPPAMKEGRGNEVQGIRSSTTSSVLHMWVYVLFNNGTEVLGYQTKIGLLYLWDCPLGHYWTSTLE
jgi:hypothetical protein